MTTVLIAGSTGLVGNAALECLLQDNRATRIIALLRKAIPRDAPRLEQWVAMGPLLSGLREDTVDSVICCLGTTLANVGGDREKFAAIDRDLVVELARWAKKHGARTLAIVSAAGADPTSALFYNRTKGQMEEAVASVGVAATHFFQPSMLVGPRATLRIGERLGIATNRLVGPLLFGRARKYRPMPHDLLARALVNTALQTETGIARHTFDAIVARARSGPDPERH